MTNVAGIPIPSTSHVFLSVVALHVVVGLLAVVSGAIAIFATKGRGTHSRTGTVYYWSLISVAATMAALAIMRWKEDRVLLLLGLIAFASVLLGHAAIRRPGRNWTRTHIAGMGTSYMVMLIAFYVDNGAHLPLWRALPRVSYWLVPAFVGVPFIVRALLFHPVVRTFDGPGSPPRPRLR